jgi:hypothetical protein
VYLMIMYLQTLQQQMRDDWNAGANMLVVTIVSLNPTETYGHYISLSLCFEKLKSCCWYRYLKGLPISIQFLIHISSFK